MPGCSETETLEAMSKAELIELTKLYAQMLLTVDGLWFVSIEKTLGVEPAVKLDEGVWRQFGALEAKRLKQFLGKESISTLEDVCKIVLISPMWISMEPKAEILDDRCHLSVTNCHPQQVRIRQGLGEFPCKSIGTAYFDGFAHALDPQLNFKCVFCPPDAHGENNGVNGKLAGFETQEALANSLKSDHSGKGELWAYWKATNAHSSRFGRHRTQPLDCLGT